MGLPIYRRQRPRRVQITLHINQQSDSADNALPDSALPDSELPDNALPANNEDRAGSSGAHDEEERPRIKCYICLDDVRQPVATLCGHMFCFPCLREAMNNKQRCPVCDVALKLSEIIPIYNLSDSHTDLRPTDLRPKWHHDNYLLWNGIDLFSFALGAVALFTLLVIASLSYM